VVAIPARLMLRAGIGLACGPMDYVKVMILEDVLDFEDGEVRLHLPAPIPGILGAGSGIASAVIDSPSREPDYCVLLDETGTERCIGKAAYEALAEQRATYAFFVDSMRHQQGRTHPTWRGKSRRPSLSASELTVLRALLQRDAPLSFDGLR